jgi:pyrimidine-nucleoside phosphorylase
LANGKAWNKFRELVIAQGGDVSYVDQPTKLKVARWIEIVPAPKSGYLSGINARIVGETAVLLGGGRTKKDDHIDHAVGVVIHHKVGDWVDGGEPLFTIHANQEQLVKEVRQNLLAAHSWSEAQVDSLPLFYGVIKGD